MKSREVAHQAAPITVPVVEYAVVRPMPENLEDARNLVDSLLEENTTLAEEVFKLQRKNKELSHVVRGLPQSLCACNRHILHSGWRSGYL